MKELVWHLWNSNRDEVIKKSLLNCHVKGLHSVMLLECPEKTIRLYIAMPDNLLYKNQVPLQSDQSIGLHAHHCDITIHVIKGALKNIIAEPVHDGFVIGKYLYKSPIISGGNGWFESLGSEKLEIVSERIVNEHSSVFMSSSEIHTVSCSPMGLTAWFVYEGKEDKNYHPYTYSFTDLTKHSNEGLYQKPTAQEIYELTHLTHA